jgi:hypothetical protein
MPVRRSRVGADTQLLLRALVALLCVVWGEVARAEVRSCGKFRVATLEQRLSVAAKGPTIAAYPASSAEGAPKPLSGPGLDPEPTPPVTPQADTGVSQKALGRAAVGMGGLALGSALVLGYFAWDGKRQLLSYCRQTNHNLCTAESLELRDRIQTYGTFATLAGVAGTTLVGVGVVLLFGAPPPAIRAPVRHSGSRLVVGRKPNGVGVQWQTRW